MSTRKERRAAAREGILAAAHRQLADGGCASASVAAVAERAGVATGSIYRHFPSRAELLAEVVGDALRGEHALLAHAVEGLTPRAALAAWVTTTVERARRAPVLTRALLDEPADRAVFAVRLRERAAQEQTLASLLDDGARTGAWPPGDAALQAAAITGALLGAVVGRAAAALGPRPDARAEAQGLVAFVLGAVDARPDGARELPPRTV